MSKLRKGCLYKGALIFSVLVAAIFILSCKTTYAAMRTQAEAIQWVKSQLNKQIDMDGYPTEQPYQCVDLIKAYYQFLGVSPVNGNGADYTYNDLPAGAGWSRMKGAVPQPGDILVYTGGYKNYGHVAIYESEYSSYHQNFGGKTCVCHVTDRYDYSFYYIDGDGNKYPTPYWGVIRPSWNNGNNPQGSFDNASGGKGYIDISGWAFDKDSSNQSLAVHVYIGGSSASSEARSYGISANKQREDINKTYNISGNHGFSERIYTDKTGNQPVYVYAINVGGGQNIEIGHKNVYIEPAAKPVISDVEIIEQDSQGYVVQCKVSSVAPIDRVQCPTWTTYNDQDDICVDWGTNTAVKAYQYGDYYRFRVNISEHNNEYGNYRTHIYVYDKSGNYASAGIDTIVKAGIMPQQIVEFDHSLISVYEENMPWTQMKEFAEKTGSQLVAINYEKKQNVVADLIKDRFRSYYNVGGYTDKKGGNWNWLTGREITPYSYTNWNTGEPNCANDNEFYLSLLPSSGKWNDVPGTSTETGFVMETSLDIDPEAMFEWNGSYYRFYNVPMPYNLAKRFCEENGGNLVVIDSKEENDFIASKTKELNHTYYIGASDEETEGKFKWVTGEDVSYQNWAEGEPNNDSGCSAENYASIKATGRWNDTCGQNDNIGFIAECKKPVIKSVNVTSISDTNYEVEVEVNSSQENLNAYLVSCSIFDSKKYDGTNIAKMEKIDSSKYKVIWDPRKGVFAFENYSFSVVLNTGDSNSIGVMKKCWNYVRYDFEKSFFIPNERQVEIENGKTIPISAIIGNSINIKAGYQLIYDEKIVFIDKENETITAVKEGRTPLVFLNLGNGLCKSYTIIVKSETTPTPTPVPTPTAKPAPTPTPTPSFVPEPEPTETAEVCISPNPDWKYYYGDVNMDRSITMQDTLMVLRHAVGIDTIEYFEKQELADVNHDTEINIMDALDILKIVIKVKNSEISSIY